MRWSTALGRDDVGHRVVLRRIVPLPGNRVAYSDVVGWLVAADEIQLTVRTRTGEVTLRRAEIAHGKRIPDRRAETSTEVLERVAAAGWPAPDLDRLGGWLLRAAEGWTNRGNSALAVGDPDVPLADAVDAVHAWYTARGIRPGVMVPAPVGGRVTAELERRGWRPQPPTLMQTAPLAPIADDHFGPRASPGGPKQSRALDVHLDEAPSEAWLAAVAGRKGPLPAAARHLLTAVPQVRFARWDGPDGAPVATARGVVADDGRWLGLSLVGVEPAHRRRGLARAVSAALAGWALGLGAERAYLQVEAHNTEAVALYAGLGFTTHHTYTTWNPA